MSPSQWLLLFTSKRQGEGGLVLVVSRGRCHVDKGMPSCYSDLCQYGDGEWAAVTWTASLTVYRLEYRAFNGELDHQGLVVFSRWPFGRGGGEHCSSHNLEQGVLCLGLPYKIGNLTDGAGKRP